MTVARHVVRGVVYVTPEGVAARARQEGQERREAERAGHRRAMRASGLADGGRQEARARDLNRSSLAFLLERGRIRAEQVRAGVEIAEVFYALTAGVGARLVASYGERLPAGVAEDWGPRIRTAWSERYRPWSDWAGAIAAGRASLKDLTVLVAADNLGCRAVGERLRLDHRSVLKHLQDSLWRYAEIGHWVDDLPVGAE